MMRLEVIMLWIVEGSATYIERGHPLNVWILSKCRRYPSRAVVAQYTGKGVIVENYCVELKSHSMHDVAAAPPHPLVRSHANRHCVVCSARNEGRVTKTKLQSQDWSEFKEELKIRLEELVIKEYF